ncbi:MAG: CvpA family protein [Nitrosomonadales bacterium]|nr:CvpA family protein [Nitrosomonadales bacterium]
MTSLDYIVIVIIVLSALLGWWRGLVYEVLSLLSWVAAFLVARLLAASVLPYMPASLGSEAIRTATAYAALFAVTLLVGSIAAWALSKLVKFVGLGWLDRSLGVLFGAARGVLVVLLLVLLAGLTDLPKEAAWRNAWLSKPLEKTALLTRAWLPDNVAQRVHY